MPKLSLCMMVRNEEASLERAVRSFDGVADEVIILDTGSTDRTRELAASLGATVHTMAWPDDFAAVRNTLFALATGEWIFHLDADEALLHESKLELLALTDREDVQAAYVLRQDLWYEDRPDAFTEMAQLRLLRKEGLTPLVGRCHPHFEPPLESVAGSAGRQVAPSNVRIRHWGYVAGRKRQKLERGARLLRLELEARPGDLYYLAELARTLYDLEDSQARRTLHEAAQALDRSIAGGQPAATGELVLLEAMLSLPESELPPSWPLAKVEDQALRRFPSSAPIRWQLARRAFERDDFSAALRHLETVRELMESGGYDRTVSFNPEIFGDELWLNLGACRLRHADLDGADECFRRIDPDGPYAQMAKENQKTLQDLRSMRD